MSQNTADASGISKDADRLDSSAASPTSTGTAAPPVPARHRPGPTLFAVLLVDLMPLDLIRLPYSTRLPVNQY
jgi:hypothetical protein